MNMLKRWNSSQDSLLLQLPNKKVCGINCDEGLFVSDEDMKIHDSRMDVFKNIQIQSDK